MLRRSRHRRLAGPVARLAVVAPHRRRRDVGHRMRGEHHRVLVDRGLPGVALVAHLAEAVIEHRRQRHLRLAVGVGVRLGQEPEVDHRGALLLPHPDAGGVVVVERREQVDVAELGGLPQPELVPRLDADLGERPHAERPEAPPERQVGAVAEVLAVRGDGIVLQRRRPVEEHAVALAHDARFGVGGDVDDELRRPVPSTGAEVGDAGVARRLVGGGRVVEHELGDVEGVLVERRHLVLLVRAPPRRGVRARLVVRGHVDEAQVERHRRGHHDLGVVGEFDEHVQRRDVLEHVDVRVPLEEAEFGALGDPFEDERLGPLEVLGAGEAGDGERLVGVALAGEVLDRPGDHDVVLRPEPEVVEAVVGQRVVPGVAVGEHAFVDGGDHVGRQLRHRRVALAEGEHPVQVHEPEVAGVLPVVDLGEHGAERLDGDRSRSATRSQGRDGLGRGRR